MKLGVCEFYDICFWFNGWLSICGNLIVDVCDFIFICLLGLVLLVIVLNLFFLFDFFGFEFWCFFVDFLYFGCNC